MTERAYTVAEIDALRQAVIRKHFSYRAPVTTSDGSTGWATMIPSDVPVADVEHYVRTYMLAGLTADDLTAAVRGQ